MIVNQKIIIKINLQFDSIGINTPKNYLGDLERINPTIKK